MFAWLKPLLGTNLLMSTQPEAASDLQPVNPLTDEGFQKGIEHQHILLSVHVATYNRIIQYDDTCAHLIAEGLKEYKGAVCVKAEVMYHHSREDRHPNDCVCGQCEQAKSAGLVPIPDIDC